MQRVPFKHLYDEFHRVLAASGLPEERAARVAQLLAENQRDGIQSHGLNRFAGFVTALRFGAIDLHSNPEKVGGLGALEQWDGKNGIGLWNAQFCMSRAIALAREHGLGCVGLKNTNHWMRAGAYGLQAAEAGCIGICWTNTIPLMPPWGSAEVRTGNNPLVIAVPRRDGPILVDMAMSQFSNGKLEVLRRQGKQLPLDGGFDESGNLTREPGAILKTRRALPIGYWKGSALAVVLDATAALISGGFSSHQVGKQGAERGVSQVFIAIDATALGDESRRNEMMDAIVGDLLTASPLAEGEPVRYPGQGMLKTRQESMSRGVLVDDAQWEALKAMK